MLAQNRIYTPEELRALTRRGPAGSGRLVDADRRAPRRTSGNGPGLIGQVLARILRRGGARRPAPGTA